MTGLFMFISSSVNTIKVISRSSPYPQLELREVSGNCFAAGTLVLCEDGYKKIEDVQVGDKVLAYDEQTGRQDYKQVVQLFRNTTDVWYHIKVNGEEIQCTAEHPFFVYGKGFVPASKLTLSDKLVQADGTVVEIQSITIEQLASPDVTYNFEVADYHTYYVTENGVLVHNKCIFDELGVRDFNEAAKKYTPDSLIDKLDDLGFTKEVSFRSSHSGPATKMTRGNLTFRIQATPANGHAYFRVQNSFGNYLNAQGLFPHWVENMRDITHFYFGG